MAREEKTSAAAIARIAPAKGVRIFRGPPEPIAVRNLLRRLF
jgi:hypothetical protein